MSDQDLLNTLPVAVYSVDASGRLKSFNDAAAELWGQRPNLESARWCGSWRLYWPDGRPIDQSEHPVAVSLREEREVRDVEAVTERPDGKRVPFIPYPKLQRDETGRVTGALCVLADVAAVNDAELQAARLAAIVSSSDDAIISKSLDGQITSWNTGAAKIFGYTADEMVGQSIKSIIPPELHPEEDEILARLSRGEHIDHFETIRLAKDGRRLDISLTVSPLRDRTGRVIGASKVARDVTERKQSEELQRLLFDELNHRVKNTLAIIQAIARQSQRSAKSPQHFVASFNGRVSALSRAHDLLVRGEWTGATLEDLIREQVTIGPTDLAQISFAGPTVRLNPQLSVQLALVLHELTTNARKYGALSLSSGHLDIKWSLEQSKNELMLYWRESGVGKIAPPSVRGFGSTTIERSLESRGAKVDVNYADEGMRCKIQLPLPQESGPSFGAPQHDMHVQKHEAAFQPSSVDLQGVRVLVVEDEALIAMEIEAALTAAGCKVVGPAGSLERAKARIEAGGFDIALLDANLAGHPVGTLCEALAEKGIPFAFATGYGKGALPEDFRNRPALTKPFDRADLISVAQEMVLETYSSN